MPYPIQKNSKYIGHRALQKDVKPIREFLELLVDDYFDDDVDKSVEFQADDNNDWCVRVSLKEYSSKTFYKMRPLFIKDVKNIFNYTNIIHNNGRKLIIMFGLIRKPTCKL